MSRVRIDRDGHPVPAEPAAPRRVVLTAAELDRLAELCDLPGPVAEFTSTSSAGAVAAPHLADRLSGGTAEAPGEESLDGSVATVPLTGSARDRAGTDEALRDSGLLEDGGTVLAEAREALTTWHSSTLTVELEMRLALRAGEARIRSWHRSRADLVVCLSSTDGARFELAWMEAVSWSHELARLALVDTRWLRPGPAAVELPARIEVPWELLLASGEPEARSDGELLGRLVSGHSGLTTFSEHRNEPVSDEASDVETERWLRGLESAAKGRLHAAVIGHSGRGRAGVGLVEWVLFEDGWRSLTPFTDRRGRMVRIDRVELVDLGVEIAVRAAQVST